MLLLLARCVVVGSQTKCQAGADSAVAGAPEPFQGIVKLCGLCLLSAAGTSVLDQNPSPVTVKNVKGRLHTQFRAKTAACSAS